MSTLPPHNMIERRLQHKQQIIVFHITWKMMLKSLLSNNSSIPHSQCLINQCALTIHCSNKTQSTLTQLQFIHFYHVCSTWCSQHKSLHHTTLIHPHSSFTQLITWNHCPNIIIPTIFCLNGNNWTRHKTYILRRHSHNDVFFIPHDKNQCLHDIPECLFPHQSPHIPCLVKVSTLKHII